MIVVDSGVLAWLWLPGEWSELAEAALRRDSEWAAPVNWRSEFRNLLGGFVRRRELDAGGALRVVEGAERLLQGQEYAVPSDRVLQLAGESGQPASDCEFVVLAEDLGAPYVTTDEALVRAFPEVAVHLEEFARPGATTAAGSSSTTATGATGKLKWRKS